MYNIILTIASSSNTEKNIKIRMIANNLLTRRLHKAGFTTVEAKTMVYDFEIRSKEHAILEELSI